MKDHFYFFKLVLLVIVSFFAGINLLAFGWAIFIANMILAVALSIKMANSYDKAWDK